MSDEKEKRIQYISNFVSNTDAFYERITDNNTGEIDVQETKKPNTTSSKTTITTNPYKLETEMVPSSKRETATAVSKLGQTKPGYDSSDL
jgi:hypothetical protein